jgi:mRNA interferase RelE/StbE
MSCPQRNLGVAWTIEYSRTARKFFEKTDRQTRHRIRQFCEHRVALLDDPRQLGKALRGPLGDLWGYRVGDLRIIADIHDARLIVLVVDIGNRREIYR